MDAFVSFLTFVRAFFPPLSVGAARPASGRFRQSYRHRGGPIPRIGSAREMIIGRGVADAALFQELVERMDRP